MATALKHSGGSVMLWALFLIGRNREMLNKYLVISTSKCHMGHRWAFQQDDAPKPMAKSAQKWFIRQIFKAFYLHIYLYYQ